MQYYGLKSIVASQKTPISLRVTSDSFFIKSERITPFIAPSFTKIEFPNEKPAILLVSAVGASGKTTTAYALSFDTHLPILDLAKHKAVGDNTLTGILTTVYPIEEIGRVLEGLRSGTQGIIIDGIDEGRSKTTEEGFEAFLDDLIERSRGSVATAIVIFGRGQVLISTWCYLVDKGADVGLVSVDPFNLDQAKEYIDAHVPNRDLNQQQNYEKARDGVLDKLGAAFSSHSTAEENAFLSFIGYPPVLDAISTLLREERNYHKIQQDLNADAEGSLETVLLVRICDYLMRRDHDNKALPNFINAIAADADEATGADLRRRLYNIEEQSARVLSRALNRRFPCKLITDAALNERYEAAVANWCPDHPFLDNSRLRNPVFAAVAIARCILSDVAGYKELAIDYAQAYRQTYHLLYFMDVLAKDRRIDVRSFNMLMQSCAEFVGINAEIEIDIEGESWEEAEPGQETASDLVMTIQFPAKQQERTFSFTGASSGTEVVTLGSYLVGAKVTLPCRVELMGRPALESVGECSVSARQVRIDSSDLVVRNTRHRKGGTAQLDAGLFIDAHRAEGHADAVLGEAGALLIQCVEHSLDYPLAKYVQRLVKGPPDPDLCAKYLRLRRILLLFRSHKRGGLAKCRAHVEHERVLKNQVGRNVLAALLQNGILRSGPIMYYLDSDQFAAKLGITWHDLRQHRSSPQLERFLRSV
jgi:hypothetical protein